MLKVVLEDLLGNLPSEREGIKGVKTEIMSGKRSNPTSEKGRIKCAGQCQVLPGIDDLMKETRNLSIYAGW